MITIITLIAGIIIVGLLLRYGKSSIGLLGSAASFATAETNALTLANATQYEGP